MRASRIEDLLRSLGCRKVKTTGTRVRSSCPLGPWRHSGRDEHPSFVVFAADEDESKCKCLGASCNFRGTLMQLLWAIENHSRVKLPNLVSAVMQYDQADVAARLAKIDGNLGIFSPKTRLPGAVEGGVEIGDLISIADVAPSIDQFKHIPDDLHALLNSEALAYLHGPTRNISDAAIQRWNLGWHPGARRISIPQYDRNKRLVNIGGRAVVAEDDFNTLLYPPIPWMHANNFKKELFLFGEDKFTSFDGTATMVLVEGMFDAIYLDSVGVLNVAAMCGAYLSRTQIAKITRWFKKLLIVPDGDPPGIKAANNIFESVGQKMDVSIFPTPDGLDPDQLIDDAIDDLKLNYI